MDTAKIAETCARAIDRIEGFEQDGSIHANSRIGAVMVIVSLDSDTPEEDRDEMYDERTQTFVFVEPENVRVALGMLKLANDNYSGD